MAENSSNPLAWLDDLIALKSQIEKIVSKDRKDLAKELDMGEGYVAYLLAINGILDQAAFEKIRQAAQGSRPYNLSFNNARTLARLKRKVKENLRDKVHEILDVILARRLKNKNIENLVNWVASGKSAVEFDPENQSAASDEETEDESQTVTTEDSPDMVEESEEAAHKPDPKTKTIGRKVGDRVAQAIDGLLGWGLGKVALGFAIACLLIAVLHIRNSLPDQVKVPAPKAVEAIPTVVFIPTPEPTVKVETPKVSAKPHKAPAKHTIPAVALSKPVETASSPVPNPVLSQEVQARIVKDTDFALEFAKRVYGIGFRNVDDREYFKAWIIPAYAPEFFAIYFANSKISEIQAKKWTESLKDPKAKLLRADETTDDFLVTGTVVTKCEFNTRNLTYTYRPIAVEIHLAHSLNMTEIVSQMREVSAN